jgi:hypothetical protein
VTENWRPVEGDECLAFGRYARVVMVKRVEIVITGVTVHTQDGLELELPWPCGFLTPPGVQNTWPGHRMSRGRGENCLRPQMIEHLLNVRITPVDPRPWCVETHRCTRGGTLARRQLVEIDRGRPRLSVGVPDSSFRQMPRSARGPGGHTSQSAS